MLNQRTATVAAIMSVLAQRGFEYELNGPTPISEVLSDKDKASVRELLFEQFRVGQVIVSESFAETKLHDDSELKKYISGLVNNWIRKAPEFNNQQKYQTKNPGSRAHVGDEQLKALQALSKQCANDPDAQKEIADAIVKRKAEIEQERGKTVTINIDAIPEALRYLIK